MGNKVVVIMFGFVSMILMTMMELSDYGILTMILAINQWTMVVSNNFALQGMIQYGVEKKTRAKADLLSFLMHSGVSLFTCLLVLLMNDFISEYVSVENLFVFMIGLIGANIFRYFVHKFFQREYRYKELFFIDLVYYGGISAFIFYKLFTTKKIEVSEIVWAFVIVEAASSLLGFLFIRKELKFSIKKEPSLKEFVRFSLPMALHSLVFSIPRRLDIVIFNAFFSDAAIGIYGAAKTLFKTFEETGFAAQAILYTASKKGHNAKDNERIRSLLIKGTSLMFVTFLFLVIILNLGLTEILVTWFLPEKYLPAIGEFNLLVFVALMIPFSSMNVYIISEGKTRLILRYALEGLIVFSIVFGCIAYWDLPYLMPIGYGLYLLYYGLRCYLYIRKNYGYTVRKIFTVIPDSISFIKEKVFKK